MKITIKFEGSKRWLLREIEDKVAMMRKMGYPLTVEKEIVNLVNKAITGDYAEIRDIPPILEENKMRIDKELVEEFKDFVKMEYGSKGKTNLYKGEIHRYFLKFRHLVLLREEEKESDKVEVFCSNVDFRNNLEASFYLYLQAKKGFEDERSSIE